jgi:murein tripeptide amidase MpaA
VASTLTAPPYDHWPRYDELVSLIEGWASARPDLLAIGAIGRSHEGREIWICEVTNSATGPISEKPAVWIDANIHSTEVTGGGAALHLIHHLLSSHGEHDRVTRALDTRGFYVVPRLNPDGVERALADRPQFVRSGVRHWPLADPQPGLHESDIDGDGRILTMRVPDENGQWRVDPDQPRLLVPRPIDEHDGGPYYRLLYEGHLVDYDGDIIKVARALEGLDFNRNFPYDWAPQAEQDGAGPYPTSEPEVRAAVQAITDRPNITHVVTYHTFGGVHLRPYGAKPDDDFPPSDLEAYKRVGAEATKITGYPCASVYHDFQYEPKTFMRGAFDDWLYEHLGVFGWTTEFWSPQRQAGVDIGMRFIEWWKDHPIEDDVKMLEWSDRELGGAAYVDWYAFDHPQLGPVEIGGWDFMSGLGNVPLPLLEREIAPHSDWAVQLALISPRLELRSLTAEPVGRGAYSVRLVLHNTGWMPTNVSQKALDRKAVRPLEVDLRLPDGARLAAGDAHLELGQLGGRPRSISTLGWSAANEPSSERTRCEWVVEAAAGTPIEIIARHPRAGVVRARLEL